MAFFADARKSWQAATRFREHLSFISPQPTPSKESNAKSAFSPITPNPTDFKYDSFSLPPPVPPLPAVHAVHNRSSTQDLDEKRSIERARAEAAAALERGAKERQAEREKKDRERWDRLLEKGKQKDLERGSVEDTREEEYHFLNAPPPQKQMSFAEKSKAALSRVSQAFIRMTSTPAPRDPAPYPRDSLSTSVGRQSRFKFPASLSDLSPWSPLNVTDHGRRNGSEAGAVHHHHYYGEGHGSRNHSRSPSFMEEGGATEHIHLDAAGDKAGKKHNCESCKQQRKRKDRRSCWCILLLILIILLLGNIVFLNVKIFAKSSNSEPSTATTVVINGTSTTTYTRPVSTSVSSAASSSSTTPTGTTASSASTTTGVSAAVQSCLSTFTNTASPASYPCSECVPILSAIPNDFTTSNAPASGQGNVLQFCALQAINAALPTANADALTQVGWLADTHPCTWSTNSCDSQGRIKSMELVTPAIPSTLPDEMKYLVGLKDLELTGDNNLPSGPMTPILGLSSLTTLKLVQTGLTSTFDDQTTLSSSLPSLTSLTLNKNPNLELSGSSVGGLTSLSLTGLSINGEQVPSNTLSLLSTGTAAGTLVSLDLSSNGLSGPFPTLSSNFPNLLELIVDGNTYSSLPDASSAFLPTKLQVISTRANEGMSGTVGQSECTALQTATVTRCDFTGTNIVLADGASCGICKFGTVASS